MAHLTRETDRMTINLDTRQGIILVRQRWFYNWIVGPGATPWTQGQRRAYHARFEAAILRSWNNRATIRASGTSDLARGMAGRSFSVRIDVQWVLGHGHWTVTVKKLPVGVFDVSKVNWAQRRIWLDTNDLTARHFARGGVRTRQVPVAHEFGHSFGNVPQRGHGDEYRADSQYRRDVRSIINVGDTLRPRHFDHLISELNQMTPGTRFVMDTVR
ncbi:MAG: hypothetical protein DI640_15205 [Sphingomonas taxi]|uniref:Uncharacterized protein n=1 Tax=Sphingomonas taxi TaxID=1549858 RepID=A0A2W4YL77_9SPHN|nr:MAG: hypothetical protein DI640_15205 [Sphingomonas taxi]